MSLSNFEKQNNRNTSPSNLLISPPQSEPIEELEYYKEKVEKLEKELHKSKIQINKLESTITKLQTTLSSYTTSNNNTSDTFLLTSEFKKYWISLGTENIMECFEHVFNRSVLLSHMVQESFLLTYQEANFIIENKITEIKKLFGITDEQCSNTTFYTKIKPLFIEFFSSIFENEKAFDNNVTNIITKLGMSIYKRQIAKYFNKEISLDLDSDNLKIFIKKSLKLCFYMHLHTPKLLINIENFENRELQYYYFNKYNYINLEGFDKENSPCLVILPPPMLKNNYPFQGLKPFVYIIVDPDEKIMECCEKNKVNTVNLLKHSRSYGGECKLKPVTKEDEELITKNETKENIDKIDNLTNNVSNNTPNNKCLVTSSSSSLLKKNNINIMEMEDAETARENKKGNLVKIPNSNVNNSNNAPTTKEHTHHQSRNGSRNIPLSNLNPIKTHGIGRHLEFSNDNKTIQQQNISIEKEINFDFICSTTTDNLKLQKTIQPNNINTNLISINENLTINSPRNVFNSDKSKKNKTKHVIKQHPKCFNIKMPNNDTTIGHDNSHLGIYGTLSCNKSNTSSNSSSCNKRTHKKIVENILNTNNTINTNNYNDKINIVYKRIKKSMPMCFTNDLLKYRNSFTRTGNNSISIANGSGEVLSIKKKDSGMFAGNEGTGLIMNYNSKKTVNKKK